jgi:hypothetical protein
MTEHEFEQQLRGFYRARADAGMAAPAVLREDVWSIPDEMPYRRGFLGPRRTQVLLVAALLTALMVGGAIAIGAGLIRNPWLPDLPDQRNTILSGVSSELLNPIPCNQEIPETVLLSAVTSNQTGPPMQLLLYEDGTVLRKPQFELPDDEDESWEQRRMSPYAIAEVLSAVEASGLTNCQQVPTAGDGVEVQARLDRGVVAFSLGSAFMRISSEAEREAASALADRLHDPDLGLGPDEWMDPEWMPVPKDRWEIWILSYQGTNEIGAGWPVLPWADLQLPDGATPLTYGQMVPNELDVYDALRCKAVDAKEAEQMKAFLETTTPDPGIFSFTDDSGGVQFQVEPLAPHEPGCEPWMADPAEPRRNLIKDLRVCDYLPERLTGEILPEPWRAFDPPIDEFGNGGWAACEYFEAWLYASRHRVPSAEAEGLVGTQFGMDYRTDVIGGRTVFFNDCPDHADDCQQAIAISAEPHFIIVAPTDSTEATLRLLAETLIQRLDS